MRFALRLFKNKRTISTYVPFFKVKLSSIYPSVSVDRSIVTISVSRRRPSGQSARQPDLPPIPRQWRRTSDVRRRTVALSGGAVDTSDKRVLPDRVAGALRTAGGCQAKTGPCEGSRLEKLGLLSVGQFHQKMIVGCDYFFFDDFFSRVHHPTTTPTTHPPVFLSKSNRSRRLFFG